jgi:hypothetical protein
MAHRGLLWVPQVLRSPWVYRMSRVRSIARNHSYTTACLLALDIHGESIYVANFGQEVVKGQLPLSMEGLRGQGVEQFGRSAALSAGLHHHLSFLDHVHELNPNECVLGCIKRFKP